MKESAVKQHFRQIVSLGLVGPILSACAGSPPPDTAEVVRRLSARPLGSPAAPGSGEPNLFAADDGVHMSWLEPTAADGWALRFATLRDDGWTAPRTIAADLPFFVNWADFPSLVALADGSLVAHWLQISAPGTYDYDVRVAVSADGGDSWSESRVLHRDGVAAEHGFVSLVPAPDGGLDAVWLDGRDSRAGGSHASSGAMTLRATTVDANGSLGAERLLDPRICDCCQTDAARVGGRLVVVYRDRSQEEIRDIYSVAREADGSWTEPVRVAEDAWQIPGCPVNGPAIAAQGDLAVVVWFGMVDGLPEVKAAYTHDGGRSFGPPVLLERGDAEAATLGRVDARWLDDETLVATWLTGRDDRAEIRYRTLDRAGVPGPTGVLATTASTRSSGFPRLARIEPGRLLLAYRVPDEPSRIELRELVSSPPDAGID